MNTDYTEELKKSIIEYRRTIHRFAELGGKEYKTRDYILSLVNNLGLPVESVTETAFIATLDTGKPGPHIALRADIDALPLKENPENLKGPKVCLSEQENTSVIRRFFSVFSNVECEKNNIKFIYNVMRREETIPFDMIPIADDPTGNVICISLSQNDYGAVYYLNHEFEDSDTGYLMKSKITDSFKEFIEKLYPDE